jgi:hypothetical protein
MDLHYIFFFFFSKLVDWCLQIGRIGFGRKNPSRRLCSDWSNRAVQVFRGTQNHFVHDDWYQTRIASLLLSSIARIRRQCSDALKASQRQANQCRVNSLFVLLWARFELNGSALLCSCEIVEAVIFFFLCLWYYFGIMFTFLSWVFIKKVM